MISLRILSAPCPPLKFAGLLLLLFLVSGCGAAVRPSPPEINLLDVRIGELTLSHANLLADLRIYNPNPVPITVEGLSYDFLLNGIRVASGQTAKEVRVGPEEYGQTSLRLSTGYLDLLQFTKGRRPGEAIKYALDGRIRIGGARVLDTVFPFLREGEIPLEKLPWR